ncbi:MAG: DUF1905 domain-containing protein [Chloroflexi bacterium]|nr:DUF1905 domain-containing protein [Chloroflexota bacterium]
MALQTFETTVQKEGTRVFINLPFTPQAAWGQAVRYVKGTLNGVEFHGSIAVRHGPCFMPLNKDLQKAASLSVGDILTVTMEPDEAQVESMPEGFAQALSAAPEAARFYETLTAFQRNTYLKWISGAKKAETQAARIEESVRLLKSGQKQH